MSKKNELKINVEYDNCVSDPIYLVEDAHTLYMRTRDRRVAEHTFNQLKAEYTKTRTKNAS